MGKARPAAAGIKFVGRAEQGFAADDVHINAGFEQVVVFVAEGVFGRAVLGNLVLLFGQEAFEFGSAGFFIRCRVKAFALRGGFGFARQRFVGFADVDVAIAVGVFNQVVLMVFLGVVEVFQRLVFDDEGKFVFLLLAFEGGGDNGFFGGVGVVHAAAVLRAGVVALFVEAGRVNDAEIVLQDVVEAEFVGIVGDFDGLGMACIAVGNVFVAWVFRFAVGIAGYCVNHAVYALEIGFQAPEAAAGKVDGARIHDC